VLSKHPSRLPTRHMSFSTSCCFLACALLLQSYYGAALCVCWSPDAALLASGGEDDLVTVYSIADRQVSIRVICC
jgi:hypothetical protein